SGRVSELARIAGVNIPTDKRVEVGLTYVYGIGPSTARKILSDAGVDSDTKVKDLTEDEVVKLREAVESLNVEGDVRRERSQHVLQQHHRHPDRYRRRRDRLRVGRQCWLQGIAKEHSIRGPGDRRLGGQEGHGARPSAS